MGLEGLPGDLKIRDAYFTTSLFCGILTYTNAHAGGHKLFAPGFCDLLATVSHSPLSPDIPLSPLSPGRAGCPVGPGGPRSPIFPCGPRSPGKDSHAHTA